MVFCSFIRSFVCLHVRPLAHSHFCSLFHVNSLMWTHVAHSVTTIKKINLPPFILLSIEAIVGLVICVSLFTRSDRLLVHAVVWFLAVFEVVNMLRLVISWIFAHLAYVLAAAAAVGTITELIVSFGFSANREYEIRVWFLDFVIKINRKKVRTHFVIIATCLNVLYN